MILILYPVRELQTRVIFFFFRFFFFLLFGETTAAVEIEFLTLVKRIRTDTRRESVSGGGFAKKTE